MLTPERIITAVADYYKISEGDLKQRARNRDSVIEPRYMAIYFIKKHCDITTSKIGKLVSSGKPFDHATVLHAVKAVNNRIDTEAQFRIKILEISSLIPQDFTDCCEFFQENDFNLN